MKKCGTTSSSRGWLPGTQPKQFTNKKRKNKGSGRGVGVGEGEHFLVCKCGCHVILRCPSFEQLRWSLKELQCIESIKSGFIHRAFKIKTLKFHIRAPAECDTLCFINKTSQKHQIGLWCYSEKDEKP